MNDSAKNRSRGKLVPLRRVDGLPAEMSDEALLAACALGDRAALGALYDRLSPHVWRFLSRMAGNQLEELEDLVQATFIAFTPLRRPSRGRPWSAPGSSRSRPTSRDGMCAMRCGVGRRSSACRSCRLSPRAAGRVGRAAAAHAADARGALGASAQSPGRPGDVRPRGHPRARGGGGAPGPRGDALPPGPRGASRPPRPGRGGAAVSTSPADARPPAQSARAAGDRQAASGARSAGRSPRGDADRVSGDRAGRPGARDGRALLVARGRGRLLLVAAMLLAGAGFAAAAWRITRGTPAPGRGRSRASAAKRAASGHGGIAPPAVGAGAAAGGGAHPGGARPAPPGRGAVAPGATLDPPGGDHLYRCARSQADVEMAFARGWSALRANDFEAAAEAFGQAAPARRQRALPRTPSSGEAWRSIRAEPSGGSAGGAARFLVRYPSRIEPERRRSCWAGCCCARESSSAADARFGSALGDPSERVRRSARAGLAASGRRHAD